MRKSLSKAQRFRIFERDDFTCQYCWMNPQTHDIALEVDHCISIKDWWDNTDENLITSCFDCNRWKSKKSVKIDRDKQISEIECDLEEIKHRLEQVKYMKSLKRKIIKTRNKIDDVKYRFVFDIIWCYSESLIREINKAVKSQERKNIWLDLLQDCLIITYEKFLEYDHFYTKDFVKYFYWVLRNKNG